MKQRIDYQKIAPEALKGMLQLEKYIANSGLETSLLELVKLRASQINGCAFCIDMHTKDAREMGETEQRLYTLSVWHETDFFGKREEAALAWTEALTLIHNNDVPDALFEKVKKAFSDVEIVALTTAINAINNWNRLAISFRKVPGSYKPEG
ncbi:MAG TPA: carboxymuconolactone decarboxylase family protein [Salinimicrobium sp.]|nr:carboxymuconolactone decarboxylase family protein [Salinimicrobium sp.]